MGFKIHKCEIRDQEMEVTVGNSKYTVKYRVKVDKLNRELIPKTIAFIKGDQIIDQLSVEGVKVREKFEETLITVMGNLYPEK